MQIARKLKIEEFKQKLKDLDMDTGNEIELNPIEDSESVIKHLNQLIFFYFEFKNEIKTSSPKTKFLCIHFMNEKRKRKIEKHE